MKVSVVIPAFNAEGFLGRTLDSVRRQTLSDLEIIVVDDGSADGTAAVAARAGPPVRLVSGPRRGVSAARNEGIAQSRGGYIAFMDHDDLWEPDKVRRQAEMLDADPRAGLVFTQARVVEDGADKETFPILPDPRGFLSKAYENLVHWNYIPMSSVMVRRSALEGLEGLDGPFDARYRLAEDWDLWLRIAGRPEGGGIGFIAEPLTLYVIVPGRATERMADLRLEDIEIFRRELGKNAWLSASDPGRCRTTLHRLYLEAGYWLLSEGRGGEARRALAAAWRLKPASLKPLGYIAASLMGRRARRPHPPRPCA